MVLCYAALAAISIEHYEGVSEGLCWCTHAGYYLIIKDAFGVSGGGGAVTSHLQLISLMLGCRRLERNAAVLKKSASGTYWRAWQMSV